jgi:hypothetical protein
MPEINSDFQIVGDNTNNEPSSLSFGEGWGEANAGLYRIHVNNEYFKENRIKFS